MTKSKKINRVPKVAEGTIIEITERTCSENLQRGVKVGGKYLVKKITELKDGTPAVEALSSDNLSTGKVVRLNAQRFRWRTVSVEEIQKVHRMKKIVEENKAVLGMVKDKFNDEELDHILFTPYIYELLTWHYVDLCHKVAAAGKLNYNKVSRDAVTSRERAEAAGSFELGEKVYKQFVYGTNVFIEEYEKPFTRIWWQVNQEIKRLYPDAKHKDLKTYAVVGILALRLLDEREEASDKLITERLSDALTHKAKRSVTLHRILEGYAEECVNMDYGRLQLCTNVMKNNIECIQFTTLHNEFRKNY